MERGAAVIAAAVGALACADPSASTADPPPRAVAVALVSHGMPITAFFSVQPNLSGQVDVRIANGIELPGQHAVFALEATDATKRRWGLAERIGGARVPFALPAEGPVRPTHVDEHAVWFFPRAGSSGWRCLLAGGTCALASAPAPAVPLTHTGPGLGFRFEVEDDTLVFRHPHQASDAPGDVVATRVKELLGIRWYPDAPSPAVQEYLDRTFRGRSSLKAGFGEVQVDGSLAEWAEAEPAVVDAPWQLSRREGWSGPADASYSVAIRWSAEQLCLAGRLRDDVLTHEDLFTAAIGRERWLLSVMDPTAEGGEAVVQPEPFGWHFEVCRPRPEGFTSGREAPFALLYHDHDGGSDADLLSTAPIFRSIPAGSVRLVP